MVRRRIVPVRDSRQIRHGKRDVSIFHPQFYAVMGFGLWDFIAEHGKWSLGTFFPVAPGKLSLCSVGQHRAQMGPKTPFVSKPGVANP